MQVESEMAAVGCQLLVALEIDGVSAILDLVADGAGNAVLSRNAVASSVRPGDFTLRAICNPVLHTQISMATSAQRPATLTQQATLRLIGETLAGLLGPGAGRPAPGT